MLPKDIVDILQKYLNENSNLIEEINNNISNIKNTLCHINQILANQVHQLLIDMETNNNEDEIIKDSRALRQYIKSIQLIDTKDEFKERESPEFSKKVYPYLISDDLCPFCNTKLSPHKIHYQRIIDNRLNSENVMWYKCKACHRLFALDYDIEDFEFENTNICLNKDKYETISQLDIYSVIVLSNTRMCSINNHRTSDVTAKLPVLDKDGNVTYFQLHASYCFECNRFTILKSDFNVIKDIVICKVIDETTEYQNEISDDFEIEQKESILTQYGYNVQTQKDLSEQQRHMILSSLIEAHIMTRREIIDHITTLIDRGSKIPKWKLATQKWREDRQFVGEYKSEELPNVIFDKIILKYKNTTRTEEQ